jgi:endonuclease YncB( thermonuclease family)
MRHPAALLPVLLLAGCGFFLEGEVARVVDGDTVDLLHGGGRDRIRFYGVDCPEIGQPYGAEATAFIRRLSPVGQRVTVHVRFALRDSFNRLRGEVILPDGRNLGHELLKEGLAWHFRPHDATDPMLPYLEEKARGEKRGLWADPGAIRPSSWRRMRDRGDTVPP